MHHVHTLWQVQSLCSRHRGMTDHASCDSFFLLQRYDFLSSGLGALACTGYCVHRGQVPAFLSCVCCLPVEPSLPAIGLLQPTSNLQDPVQALAITVAATISAVVGFFAIIDFVRCCPASLLLTPAPLLQVFNEIFCRPGLDDDWQ